ncbi:MAG: 6,7-dimethyl-8-ribityllumazine synthase [Xanthomonadaceae bacterium]|nr:6,7-dimethyl-8-ribityllumazine synthase [Xanthomonadaceae bacterium]
MIAIVWSKYHKEITDGLLAGAKEILAENEIPFFDKDLFVAPGAFEMPLIAKKIAESGKYQGVVCLGCVIKGDTAHFEYISDATAHGLQNVALQTGVPIGFGILTTYNEEQALLRSRSNTDNKGREATLAVVKSVKLLSKF